MPNPLFGERVAQNMWRLAPKRLLSRMIGWGARRKVPHRLQISQLRTHATAYRFYCAEAEHPVECFDRLQAFSRRFGHGVYPIPADEQVVFAPSAGAICKVRRATEGKRLDAKGSFFTLRTLLADKNIATRLTGGHYVRIYFSTHDYHRVHFPLSVDIVTWSYIPGKFFPVGYRSVKIEPGLFAKIERFVTVVDSQAGRYAVVMVAAVGVGHITSSYDAEVATYDGGFSKESVRRKQFSPPKPIQRGQKLGISNLGSAFIAIFEPGRIELNDLVPCSQIAMGAPVGRIIV
jgi:phosphatidylserine decarboxylase